MTGLVTQEVQTATQLCKVRLADLFRAVYTDPAAYAMYANGGLRVVRRTRGNCPIVKLFQAIENQMEH